MMRFKKFLPKKVNVATHFMFKLKISLKGFTRRTPDRINLYNANITQKIFPPKS